MTTLEKGARVRDDLRQLKIAIAHREKMYEAYELLNDADRALQNALILIESKERENE